MSVQYDSQLAERAWFLGALILLNLSKCLLLVPFKSKYSKSKMDYIVQINRFVWINKDNLILRYRAQRQFSISKWDWSGRRQPIIFARPFNSLSPQEEDKWTSPNDPRWELIKEKTKFLKLAFFLSRDLGYFHFSLSSFFFLFFLSCNRFFLFLVAFFSTLSCFLLWIPTSELSGPCSSSFDGHIEGGDDDNIFLSTGGSLQPPANYPRTHVPSVSPLA